MRDVQAALLCWHALCCFEVTFDLDQALFSPKTTAAAGQ